MRIAIINPPLLGHATRGTGVYMKNISVALKKHTAAEVEVVETTYLPQDVDLYHFPYFDPFFLTLPLFRSKPTVVTIHDLIPLHFSQYFPRGLKGEFKWQIQKFLVRNVSAIIVDSQASKLDVMKYIEYDPKKIFVIYLAPTLNFTIKNDMQFKKHVREKYNLPPNYLLYVGDMNWNKNVPNIIKAATDLKIPLVIVSRSFVQRHDISYNPWKESLLEAQALAKNNFLIHGVGYVETDDLIAIYQMAQILVFPSYYEGFGLPVVEAFAVGCPVISSDRGSLKEVTGKAALVVNPESAADIKRGISYVYDNKKLRKEMIQKGKRQVVRFNWQKTAAETFQVYQNVLNKKL